MKALVTNAGEDGGLAAARSLANAGFEVVGADVYAATPGFRSRYMTQYHQLDGPSERQREAALLRLIGEVRPDVFLPIGTRAVLAAARHRDRLSALTAVSVVDQDAFMAAYDKSVCMTECRRLGIGCATVYSFTEALAVLEQGTDRAVVVKPRWDLGAALGVSYVREPAALRETVDDCRRLYGDCLIQDCIPGAATAMKTVLLLFTPATRLAAAFTTQKVRHWPQTGGPTAASRSTDEPDLVELVLPFFRAWHWRGPAEVELKLDARDGRHKVIEINPRFPGYLRFARYCGLDVPLLAVQSALGDVSALASELVPSREDSCDAGSAPGNGLPVYRVGKPYIAPTLFLRTFRDDARSLGIGAAVRKAKTDLRGSAAVILDMLADPGPLLVRTLRSTPPSNRPARAMLEEFGVLDP